MKARKSPTNTYIAVCIKSDFSGFYFQKFKMPDEAIVAERSMMGYSISPAWYFMNVLDFVACIEGVYAAEDMQMEVKEIPEETYL